MKTVCWYGNRDVRVESVPDPVIHEPTDAIIRVAASGICGSDLHLCDIEPGDTVAVWGCGPVGQFCIQSA